MRVNTVVSTDRLAKFALNLKSNHYADGYWGIRGHKEQWSYIIAIRMSTIDCTAQTRTAPF